MRNASRRALHFIALRRSHALSRHQLAPGRETLGRARRTRSMVGLDQRADAQGIAKHVYTKLGRGAVVIFDVDSHETMHKLVNQWSESFPPSSRCTRSCRRSIRSGSRRRGRIRWRCDARQSRALVFHGGNAGEENVREPEPREVLHPHRIEDSVEVVALVLDDARVEPVHLATKGRCLTDRSLRNEVACNEARRRAARAPKGSPPTPPPSRRSAASAPD